MERKKFLRNGIGLLGSGAMILQACRKTAATSTTGTSSGPGGCIVSPEEVEGPYPYAGGEITNPLQRADITGGQPGVPLSLTLNVVNTNSSCAAVAGARVDIWHCNKDGYYSGYAGQTSYLGTLSYVGQTWLRGYQLSGADGKVTFNTIYPGWYPGRATHIHLEIFVSNVLKKTSQITFADATSDVVHTSSLYAAHGTNTTRITADSILGNSATDLANETVPVTGSVAAGYSGSITLGIAL